MGKTKLTLKNYYTKKNTYISNSKISVWLKDKNLYKRKFIDHTFVTEPTDAMTLGKAIDLWLTGSRKAFEKAFKLVDRRSDKHDHPYDYQLNPTQYSLVEAICTRVEQLDIYQDIKNYKKQVILTDDGLNFCGMLDFLHVDQTCKTAIIVDLKTSNTVDKRKYWYHAKDLGYMRQMAGYKLLVQKNYPEIARIDCYHLVVEKDNEGVYKCELFRFDEIDLLEAKDVILKSLEAIKVEKDFSVQNIKWSDSKDLLNPKQLEWVEEA